MTRRHELLAIGAVVLVGFVLRVVYVLDMQANPLHERPVMDAGFNLAWARAFAAGEPFGPLEGRPFFRAPLYVWFVGVLLKLFGEDALLAVRIVQSGLGTATVALTYAVGKRAFDHRVGLLAAIVAATYWVLIYFDAELLIPTLIVPLDLLAIWLTLGVATAAKRRTATAAAAGFCWGLSAIARPNVLLFMPFLAVWLVWRGGAPSRRGAGLAAVFAAALLAPILPITAYNAVVKDDLVLISSQAGVNLFIGNNPQADGTTAVVPGTSAEWWQGYYDAIAIAEREILAAERAPGQAGDGVREVKASEVSRYYTGRAFAFWRDDPGRAIALLIYKLRLFWTDWEFANNADVRFFAHHFSAVPKLSIGFAPIAAFGLVGLALALRAPRRHLPLAGFVLVYMASVVVFFVNSRFRVPVLPPLMILGSFAVFWLLDALRARRIAAAAAGLVCVTVLGLASRAVPAHVIRDDSNGLFQLGVAAVAEGETERAIELLGRAVEANPRNVDARIALGTMLKHAGRPRAALTQLERAVRDDPSKVDALDPLLGLLYDAGRWQRLGQLAAPHLRGDGCFEPAYFHSGRAALQRGRVDRVRAFASGSKRAGETVARAFDLLAKATECNRRSFRAPFAAGNAALALEDRARARVYFERAHEALDSAPASAVPEGLQELAGGFAAAGDAERACAVARELAEREPLEARLVERYCR